MVEADRRQGFGRRSADDLTVRIALLESEIHRQFSDPETLHHQDHQTLRKVHDYRLKAFITLGEKLGFAFLIFCVVLLAEGFKRWLSQ